LYRELLQILTRELDVILGGAVVAHQREETVIGHIKLGMSTRKLL